MAVQHLVRQKLNDLSTNHYIEYSPNVVTKWKHVQFYPKIWDPHINVQLDT